MPVSGSRFILKPWVWIPFFLILVVLIILTQIDLESVKESMIQKVSRDTGLKVEIDSIGFGFSRGLGLQCKGVKVSTPKGDQYSVDRLDLVAAWSPLFKGEFKIKSATLEHPVIKLELPETPKEPIEKEQPGAEKEKPAEEQGLIDSKTLQSTTGKIKDTPLSIDKFVVSNGEVTLTRPGSASQLPLNVDGTFVLNRDEHLDLLAQAVKVQIGTILLEGDGTISNLTADDAGISLNLKASSFSLKEIQPALQFFGQSGLPLESVEVDRLLLKTGFRLDSLSQIEVLKKKMTGHIDLKIHNAILKLEDRYSIESLEGEGIWENGMLTHEFSGTALGSNFSLNGKLAFSGPENSAVSRIEWKNLNLQQLPLKKGLAWSPVQGMVSGSLTLTGPLPKDDAMEKLKIAAEFQAADLVLQPADASHPISLSNLKGSANIENHQVYYNIKANAFSGALHSGGTLTLSASGPVLLKNQIEFDNIDLSQLPTTSGLVKGNISGTVKLTGPLPDPEQLLTGNLKIDTAFHVTDLNIQTFKIQRLEGKTSLNRGRLTHDLNGNIFGGKIATKGSSTFHKNSPIVTTDSNLMMDQISLGWVPLVYQGEWAPSSGTMTGDLKIKGPVPSDGKISPDLKLKGVLAGQNLAFENRHIETAQLEFKESSANLTQAQIELKGIKLGDRDFKKVLALFKITPEKIDLTEGRVWPVNGLIQLVGSLQPKSGNYRVKFKGDKLKVEELLPQHLMGPLAFSGALAGTLPQGTATPGLPDYSRDLSGDIKINLVDGSIPELGAVEGLLTLLNPTTALSAQKEGLSYDYMGGDFKIIKGVVHTDNFEMKSPQVNMNVVGKANLVEDTVLAQVKAMPLQMLDKTIKAIPLLGQILTGGKKGGVIEVYVKVNGKLSQPDFMVQPHKSLTEKPGSILKGILALPGNLGGGE